MMGLIRSHSQDGPKPSVPVVAVLGLYRGGSSCTAGVLYHLGLHMGAKLMKADRKNARGYYEPAWLSRKLRRLYDEPRLAGWAPRPKRLGVLRRWYESQGRVAEQKGTLLGVKHPLLCVACDDLAEAWGDALRVIAVDRPMADCVASLDRVGWWRRDVRRRLLTRLWDEREAFLAERNHLRIDYHELLATPRPQVERIVAHLGLPASPRAVEAACAFVDPELEHVDHEAGAAAGGTGLTRVKR